MLRNLSRIFVILIVAGTLTGGVYAFSNIALAQSTDPISIESQPEPAVGVPDADPNTDSAQVGASAEDLEHRPPEDLPVWARFSGILGHMVVIAGIVMVVAYIQKLIKWVSVKPKVRISHQGM